LGLPEVLTRFSSKKEQPDTSEHQPDASEKLMKEYSSEKIEERLKAFQEKDLRPMVLFSERENE
jgi:hypothetical protein